MITFKDEHGDTWEARAYGAEAPGKADGPPPEGDRMVAFHHPSEARATRTYTTSLPDDSTLKRLSEGDLRELLAIARDSES